MSWGKELWDQYHRIQKQTQDGIEFCERYCQFVRDRCSIELEYAKKLRSLVKKYQPKKKDEDDYKYSTYKAFASTLNEVNDIAGQHEVIAENLLSNVVKEIASLVTQIKAEKKKHVTEGNSLESKYDSALKDLEKSKKNYEKHFREAERAQGQYEKVDNDNNVTKADVEKARVTAQQKTQTSDQCKSEYAAQLQQTNKYQSDHFSTYMPAVFQQLQEMDEQRITRMGEVMAKFAETQRQVIPIIGRCLDGITNAANSVNPQQDSQLVISRYKSGYVPPGDQPFEDLSANGGNLPKVPSQESIRPGTERKKTKTRDMLKGLFVTSKAKPSDLESMPPEQRKKHIQKELEKLEKEVKKKTDERDAMTRMRELYTQNPALGDASSIQAQLEENGKELDRLRQDLHKWENLLSEAEGTPTLPTPQTNRSVSQISNLSTASSTLSPNGNAMSPNSSGASPNRHSTSASSISPIQRFTQMLCFPVLGPPPPTPQVNRRRKCVQHPPIRAQQISHPSMNDDSSIYHSVTEPASEESLSREPSKGLTRTDSFDGEEAYGDYDEEQAIGRCRALYPFESSDSDFSNGSNQDSEDDIIPSVNIFEEPRPRKERPLFVYCGRDGADSDIDYTTGTSVVDGPGSGQGKSLQSFQASSPFEGDIDITVGTSVVGCAAPRPDRPLSSFTNSFTNEGNTDVITNDPLQDDPVHDQQLSLPSVQSNSEVVAGNVTHMGDDGGERLSDDDDVFHEEPVLGRGKVLYTFQGDSEGTMSIQEGEIIDFLSEDDGGWTKARRPTNGEVGYVPTTYLEVEFRY
ncbi:formin-binding protein 1-like isoform X2 [Branchiostoma floridae x Branchiostoma japonicum]